jgi:hypothetical protein
MPSKRPMRLIILIGVLIVACGGFWLWADATARRKFQQEKENLAHDFDRYLPIGSRQTQIAAFLNERRIAFSELEPQRQNGDDMVQMMWARDPWYKDADKAIVGNTNWIRAPLRECRLELELKIDKTARLLGHRERTVCKDSFF